MTVCHAQCITVDHPKGPVQALSKSTFHSFGQRSQFIHRTLDGLRHAHTDRTSDTRLPTKYLCDLLTMSRNFSRLHVRHDQIDQRIDYTVQIRYLIRWPRARAASPDAATQHMRMRLRRSPASPLPLDIAKLARSCREPTGNEVPSPPSGGTPVPLGKEAPLDQPRQFSCVDRERVPIPLSAKGFEMFRTIRKSGCRS